MSLEGKIKVGSKLAGKVQVLPPGKQKNAIKCLRGTITAKHSGKAKV